MCGGGPLWRSSRVQSQHRYFAPAVVAQPAIGSLAADGTLYRRSLVLKEQGFRRVVSFHGVELGTSASSAEIESCNTSLHLLITLALERLVSTVKLRDG